MTEKHERLRLARIEAGYDDATTAAKALHIAVPTYTSHENGTRGFRADSAEAYAKKFNVAVEWLLYGRGPSLPTKICGFSESEVTKIDMEAYKLLTDISKNKSHIAPFRVSSGVEALGFRPGTLLLVDLKNPPESGDYVVATKDDRALGTSATLLRRLVGDHLVGSNFTTPELIDETVTIRGRIIKAISEF